MGGNNSEQQKSKQPDTNNPIHPQNEQPIPSGRRQKGNKDRIPQKGPGGKPTDSNIYQDEGKELFNGVMNSLNDSNKKGINSGNQKNNKNQNLNSLPHNYQGSIQDQVIDKNVNLKDMNLMELNRLRAHKMSHNNSGLSRDINASSFLKQMERMYSSGSLNIPVKLTIINIKPHVKDSSYKLQKYYSQHNGLLTWSSKQNNKRQSQQRNGKDQFELCKFKLIEDQNYISDFLVQSQDGQIIKGDQDLWKIINPIPSIQILNAHNKKSNNVVKVGPYYCQSTYIDLTQENHMETNNNLQGNAQRQAGIAPSIRNLPIRYDIKVLEKWGEHLSKEYNQPDFYTNPSPQKKLGQGSKLIEYYETNRYFSANNNQWHAGVFAQERDSQFEAWIVENAEKLPSGNQKSMSSFNSLVDNMSKSFQNDVKNREEMFLKSMKQRYVMQQVSIKKVPVKKA